ncbi:MAG: SpoVA/SpoVAEb family sporulation membrane protein [Erysipelotrichaceae bacterium]|nr:SpoVA/SpoVAEb family sporulation membrane protein [Erysipelotrichaceae bacterium]MCI9313122.1 SpoVA/SpoVAEb family sporulation membrane protein [Erysipelotrichaceae bacterium]
MEKKRLQETAKKHVPPQHKGKNALIAFICGGTIGALGQCLLYLYMELFAMEEKSALSLVVVTIILATALATGFGVYDKLAQRCGAGLFIPISGFANALSAAALEGRSEGPIYGIGTNMFKLAGSVLTYGIASAFFFGALRFLMFGG